MENGKPRRERMARRRSNSPSKADGDYYLTLIEEGIAATDAGDLIDHNRVVAWVRSWGKSDELPEPRSNPYPQPQ
jgi:predicted transcriptional regulator